MESCAHVALVDDAARPVVVLRLWSSQDVGFEFSPVVDSENHEGDVAEDVAGESLEAPVVLLMVGPDAVVCIGAYEQLS